MGSQPVVVLEILMFFLAAVTMLSERQLLRST
jgi:hypothetical protein